METGWPAGVWDYCAAFASDMCKDGARSQINHPRAGSVQLTDQLGYAMASGFRVGTVWPAAVLALVCHWCDGANVKIDERNGQLTQRKGRASRREGRYAKFWEEQLFVPIMHLALVPPSSQNILFLTRDDLSLLVTLHGKEPLRD